MSATLERASSLGTGTLDAAHSPDPRIALPRDVARAVLRRNSIACFWQRLDDGAIRSFRERYAATERALYLPAWNGAHALCREPPIEIECAVSEVDGLASWRLVWVSGHAALLQPTGDTAERAAWRTAVGQLRRVITGLASSEDLMFGSFNVVRLDILHVGGTSVQLD